MYILCNYPMLYNSEHVQRRVVVSERDTREYSRLTSSTVSILDGRQMQQILICFRIIFHCLSLYRDIFSIASRDLVTKLNNNKDFRERGLTKKQFVSTVLN